MFSRPVSSEWKPALKPGILIESGTFSASSRDWFRIVREPLPMPLPINDRQFTAVLKNTIQLEAGDEVVLEVSGAGDWRLPAKAGANYKLLVSNLPPFFFGGNGNGHGHGPHARSHFQYYYELGLQNWPGDKFDLLPAARPHPSEGAIEVPQLLAVPKYPCLGIHLAESSPPVIP